MKQGKIAQQPTHSFSELVTLYEAWHEHDISKL